MSTTYGRTLEINLTQLDAPFLSTDAPRHSVVADMPQNGSGGLTAQQKAPQITYMRNVLPTIDGYSSLQREEFMQAINFASVQNVEHVFSFTANDGLEYLCAKTPTKIFFARLGPNEWADATPNGLLSPFELTSTELDGEFYFFASESGAYKFVPDTLSLTPSPFVGIIVNALLGLTSASGYLVAYDRDRIYWDSPATRGNFTPAIGGAGSARVSALRGDIVCCLPLANGYIIYSNVNAVAAQFSGNPNNPWVFREIPSASGVKNQYRVAHQRGKAAHFAWTNSGMQEIAFQQAQNVFPQLSEYLNKQTIETFNELTGFTRVRAPSAFEVKLQFIANRYLVISYGTEGEQLQMAHVYDLDLRRWGVIRSLHRAFFELSTDSRTFFVSYNYEAANENRTYEDLAEIRYTQLKDSTEPSQHLTSLLGSADIAGIVRAYPRTNLEFVDEPLIADEEGFVSEVIIGRLSFNKTRPTLIHEIEVQNFVPQVSYGLTYNGEYVYDGSQEHDANDDQLESDQIVLSSLTYDPFEDISASAQTPMERARSKYVRRYTMRKTAVHFAVVLAGKFELTNINVQFDQAGYR